MTLQWHTAKPLCAMCIPNRFQEEDPANLAELITGNRGLSPIA